MKKILILIISIGLIFGLVGIGTQAYFNDVETSSGNVFAADTWDSPIENIESSSQELTSVAILIDFSFQELTPAVVGVVDEGSHAVTLAVPFETDVTTLVPTIVINGTSVDPASGLAQDFTNPVTYTIIAADFSTQVYVVTVNVKTASDSTAPVITAPADQTFEATGPETEPTLAEATATDTVDPNPVITYAPHSFNVGDNTVTWTATDASGNTSTVESKVTITDNTAPVITAPADQTFEATGPETEPTLAEATATDTVDPNPVITYAPHSFNVGDNTVTWTATDASGNTSTVESKVTITDSTAPVITLDEAPQT